MSQFACRLISLDVVLGVLALKPDTDWWRKDFFWLVSIILSTPSVNKLCFMSTIRQRLSSVIYQNLIILHTGSATPAPFLFLRPCCHWSVNCRHHRPSSPPQSLPASVAFIHHVLFLFPLHPLYLLLASWHSVSSLYLPPCPLCSHSPYLLLRRCPGVSVRFLTFQGRGSWQFRKVTSCVQ